MQEAVRDVKNGWLVVIAIAGIAAAYFFLLGTSSFEDPGPNIEYNMQAFEDLDKIDTPFEEKASITPSVPNPRALAVANGKIYLACENAVLVYGEGDKEIARHTISGVPSCIGVAPDGTMYVAMRDKVTVLGADGSAKGEWKEFNPRSFITAIAARGEDVFVADAGNRIVNRFDTAGKMLNTIGQKDPAKDVPGLEVPSPYLDLGINPDGDLWVVNPGRLGLEQYQPDGTIVTNWYNPSLKLDGFPGCCNPSQIAFDSKGRLFTCEKGLVRVKQYEVTAGTFDGLAVSSKSFPQQQSVRDFAIDAQDRLLIVDGKAGTVRVFVRKESNNGTAGTATQPQ